MDIFIGGRDLWGSGYAAEAISRVSWYVFDELNLFRLEVGCCEDNIGSLRAFLKYEFSVKDFFRKKIEIDGRLVGCFWLGVLGDGWTEICI